MRRTVLAGTGEATVHRADGSSETIPIAGTPRSYPLVQTTGIEAGVLTLDVTPGVEVYSFTFG